MDLFKRAIKFASVALAGVSGAASLIFGLSQDGTAFVAWVSISGLLLAIFAYIAIALIVRVARKVAGHDSAIEQAAEAREKLAEAEKDLEAVPALLKEARETGRMDTFGAILAMESGASLRVKGMTKVGGELFVVATLAEGECPQPGARFLLRTVEAQTKRGIVAIDTIGDRGKILLAVKDPEPGSEAFWEEADRRAETTESTPGKLELVVDPLLAEIAEEVEL